MSWHCITQGAATIKAWFLTHCMLSVNWTHFYSKWAKREEDISQIGLCLEKFAQCISTAGQLSKSLVIKDYKSLVIKEYILTMGFLAFSLHIILDKKLLSILNFQKYLNKPQSSLVNCQLTNQLQTDMVCSWTWHVFSEHLCGRMLLQNGNL